MEYLKSMFHLITLVVLVTLFNIALADPLCLNSGSARFLRIRSVGPGTRVYNTRSTTVASSVPSAFPPILVEISSASTLEHPPLQSSTTSISARSSSNSQKVASVAGDGAAGKDVVFKFPNGSPAATVFITTASIPSTTKSETVRPTTTPPTTQSVTTVPLTRTPFTPGHLSGAQPILSSLASGQLPNSQSTPSQLRGSQSAQGPLNATGTPCLAASCSTSATSLSAALPNSSTIPLPAIGTTQTTGNARGSQPSPTGFANHTTAVKITSKVRLTLTVPATAPTLPSAPTPQSNLAMARALNIIFRTLTSDAKCNLNRSMEAVACVNGQLAFCGSSGTYSLTQCPSGMQCFALPKTMPGYGAEISCDTAENARLILGQNVTSPKSAIGSQTDAGNPSMTGGNSISSPTAVASSPILPVSSNSRMSSSTNSVPQFPAPTTFITITFLPGSLRAPNLPAELPTGGVTTTVTQTIPIPSTSHEFHTRRTKPSQPDRSTTAGGVSSIVVPRSVVTVTETVTSMATVTETVTTTATVKV